ncbi:MAG: hypothetical protein LBE38_09900 [Deltaproteobacteria bacterium]|jgi:hypothetical protein|nr:hypothetical protein [Deltaproteobacteria bacterium]
MASIFIRPLKGRQYYGIYGAKPTRVKDTVNNEQNYLGKVLIPSGNVIFNDKLENWIEVHDLDMNYVYEKILSSAKKFDLPINFINQNVKQTQDDKTLSDNIIE